jgi:hypothetical protein
MPAREDSKPRRRFIGVLDIPLWLRFAMSLLPCFALYKTIPLLYRMAHRVMIARRPMHAPKLVGFLVIMAAVAVLSLYQSWRTVRLKDFKLR